MLNDIDFSQDLYGMYDFNGPNAKSSLSLN